LINWLYELPRPRAVAGAIFKKIKKFQKMNIENIMVYEVSQKRLLKKCKITLADNEELIVNQIAIYKDEYIIDTDCCFHDTTNEVIKTEIKKTALIGFRIARHHKNGYTLRGAPEFYQRFFIEDLIKISKEVPLIEFIRYNYNPRIIANQKNFLSYATNR
jgi:UTP:GlnB (protein PII) uridylyltransferase